MTFRVGLLFYSIPAQPFVPAPVAELLQRIDKKSEDLPNRRPLTLVPFVRTTETAAFAQSVADIGYTVEAVAFDEAGVTFGQLAAFVHMQHPKFKDQQDFDLGMSVLLSCCDVIVIICQKKTEFLKIRERLELYRNTHVLLSLVSIQDAHTGFLKINAELMEMERLDWMLALTKRWKAMQEWTQPLPKRKTTILGVVFPLFQKLITSKISGKPRKGHSTKAERCAQSMGLSQEANEKLEPPDRKLLDTFLTAACRYFTRHDELGSHYSNVFRTTCLLVPLLIVASTVLAVVAAIDTIHHDLWHIVEAALLVVAAILFWRSKIAKHHRKWVENRLLAEFLRLALIGKMFHIIPRLTLPAEEPKLWIDQSRILLQYLRTLPQVAFTTPKEELLSARKSAISDFLSYQAKWHENFAGQHRTAEKRLTRISFYAFVITLCLCILQLIIAYNLEAATGIAHTLMLVTLISASCAFVILLLSHQLGFEAIAERSDNAAEHFRLLQQTIEQSRSNADARQVYEWAHECANAILVEQHSWYRQIPLIRMHL